MKAVCHNGKMVPALQPLFTAGNRSFRYGDGLFETLKVIDGNICLETYHWERLFTSLSLLQIQPASNFTTENLPKLIGELCQYNACSAAARVRLAVYRNDNSETGFVIEAEPLPHTAGEWNPTGWAVQLYPLARKSCDALANIKSANYLPYVLAGRYAAEKSVDEVLVLNVYNHICDGSKTNLFLIREGEIYTPPLSEGCVNGVVRRWLIDTLKQNRYTVHQNPVTENDLLSADEVFCTNAIQGLRWVQSFGNRQYGHAQTLQIWQSFFEPIHQKGFKKF